MYGKTLDELENVVWGPPEYSSSVVLTCHRLRKKPITEFTIEDLRIMIGQKIGLDHLVPLAIAELERNPLAEGDFFPGDLFCSVAHCAEWVASHRDVQQRLFALVDRALTMDLAPEGEYGLREALASLLERVSQHVWVTRPLAANGQTVLAGLDLQSLTDASLSDICLRMNVILETIEMPRCEGRLIPRELFDRMDTLDSELMHGPGGTAHLSDWWQLIVDFGEYYSLTGSSPIEVNAKFLSEEVRRFSHKSASGKPNQL